MEEFSEEVHVIQLDMMDKSKFYPLTICSSLINRVIVYPSTLIRTRLQMQKGKSVYNGTFDAFVKIRATEGVRGLYRGFTVNSLQVVNSLVYITVYENFRQYLVNIKTSLTPAHQSMLASGMSGFSAAFAGQTLSVPMDIVSQHLMLIGQRRSGKKNPDPKIQKKLSSLQGIHIPEEAKSQRFGAAKAVVSGVYKTGGLGGFYKGYFVSTSVISVNSALWWPLYEFYSPWVLCVTPSFIPDTLAHGFSAALGGGTTVVLTNAIDLVRVRMQVTGTRFVQTCKVVWKEEGLRILTKSLTARIANSVPVSFLIMTFYSTIKRLSLKEEYRNTIR